MDDYATRVAKRIHRIIVEKLQRQRGVKCPHCEDHFLITENNERLLNDERFVNWFVETVANSMELELDEEAAMEADLAERDDQVEDCPGCLGQGFELDMHGNIIQCMVCNGVGKQGELSQIQKDLLRGFHRAAMLRKSQEKKKQMADLKIQQMAGRQKRERNKRNYYDNKYKNYDKFRWG